MAIFVTMKVGPVDWNKFKAAIDWGKTQPAANRASSKVYRSADGEVLVAEEWESHDAMHSYQDRVGDEFNQRAGTDGMEWDVNVWELAESM